MTIAAYYTRSCKRASSPIFSSSVPSFSSQLPSRGCKQPPDPSRLPRESRIINFPSINTIIVLSMLTAALVLTTNPKQKNPWRHAIDPLASTGPRGTCTDPDQHSHHEQTPKGEDGGSPSPVLYIIFSAFEPFQYLVLLFVPFSDAGREDRALHEGLRSLSSQHTLNSVLNCMAGLSDAASAPRCSCLCGKFWSAAREPSELAAGSKS
ncbi:MAG: hypothetical protein Q9218_000137 [Villophora microphyllina]